MTRSRVISALLGLILVACAAVIVLDQQGMFGTGAFPWPGNTSNNPSPVPPDTSGGTDGGTEIQPTPTPTPQPPDDSGYGGLK